jgi:hypothetical protein
VVLVPSGGRGREVHLSLRAAALPGADYVLPLLAWRQLLGLGGASAGLLELVRLEPRGDVRELARAPRPLHSPGSRQAFLHTLRAVSPANSASARTTGFVSPPQCPRSSCWETRRRRPS